MRKHIYFMLILAPYSHQELPKISPFFLHILTKNSLKYPHSCSLFSPRTPSSVWILAPDTRLHRALLHPMLLSMISCNKNIFLLHFSVIWKRGEKASWMMWGKEEGGRVGVDLFCQLFNVHLMHRGNDLHHLNSVNKNYKKITTSKQCRESGSGPRPSPRFST